MLSLEDSYGSMNWCGTTFVVVAIHAQDVKLSLLGVFEFPASIIGSLPSSTSLSIVDKSVLKWRVELLSWHLKSF